MNMRDGMGRWLLVLGLVAVGMVTVATAGRAAEAVSHHQHFTLHSPAFKNGGRLPKKFTADGADVSPPLSWSRSPRGARSLLIIMFDPDAPGPMPFLHWVVFNIPPGTRSLPAHLPPHQSVAGLHGAKQGKNSFGGRGYGGPAPPPGPAHHYRIAIYALNRKLAYAPDCFRCLQHAIAGHILAHAEIRVTYGR